MNPQRKELFFYLKVYSINSIDITHIHILNCCFLYCITLPLFRFFENPGTHSLQVLATLENADVGICY